MALTMVVAISDDGAIGDKGTLPWCIPEDLKHFKRVTMGRPIIMGRRTHESIGKALPGRRNIVVASPERRVAMLDVEFVSSPEEALELACQDSLAAPCVIGGASIYKSFTSQLTEVWLTEVHARYPDADTRLDFDRFFWVERERRDDGLVSFVRLEPQVMF